MALAIAAVAPEPSAAKVCSWAAWMEECTARGWLVVKTSRSEFEAELTTRGNDGMHLVAADYGRGYWFGYFQEATQPGEEWRWVSGSFEYVRAEMADGIKNGWKPTGAFYADDPETPAYVLWMSRAPGQGMSQTLTHDFDIFVAMWSGMEPDDQSALTGFYLDGSNPWLGWVSPAADWRAAVSIETYDGLVARLDEFIHDGFHVTSMINGHEEWAIFGTSAPGRSSTWITRATTSDMVDAILEVSGQCVSVLTHGCTQV